MKRIKSLLCAVLAAVTFLWAAAGRPEPASDASPFTDVADPGDYYYSTA